MENYVDKDLLMKNAPAENNNMFVIPKVIQEA